MGNIEGCPRRKRGLANSVHGLRYHCVAFDMIPRVHILIGRFESRHSKAMENRGFERHVAEICGQKVVNCYCVYI